MWQPNWWARAIGPTLDLMLGAAQLVWGPRSLGAATVVLAVVVAVEANSRQLEINIAGVHVRRIVMSLDLVWADVAGALVSGPVIAVCDAAKLSCTLADVNTPEWSLVGIAPSSALS